MCLRYKQTSVCFPPVLFCFLLLSIQNFGREFLGWFFYSSFSRHHSYTVLLGGSRGTDRERAPASFQVTFKGDPDFIFCALTGYSSELNFIFCG